MAAASNGSNTGVSAVFCQEGPCWPSTSEWQALNATVNGRLIAIDLPLKPCASSKNDATCLDLLTKSADADWVSSLPGGYAYPVFTQDGDSNMCFLHVVSEFDSFRDSGACDQGSISSFGVAVTSDAEISTTLAFAMKKNLQVVIKNTGHDLQGRSIGSKYALMIWLNNYSKVEIKADYKACASDAAAPAVIASGGARWGDVYSVVKAANFHVVGGASRTVGAVGGWVQGGGHSFSSPAFGLGVDNVVKFNVVLTNGTAVEASSCVNPDLFWAWRGGGTFGIVTSVAYKLHKTQVVTGCAFDYSPQTLDAGAQLLTHFFTWIANMSTDPSNNLVVGGYPFIYGSQLAGAEALVAPLKAKLDALVEQKLLVENDAALTDYTSFLDWHAEAYPTSKPETVGTLSNFVARLVPKSLCAQPEALVKVLMDYVDKYPYFMAQLNLVTGGAVSTADTDSTKTSVTPSWRDSSLRRYSSRERVRIKAGRQDNQSEGCVGHGATLREAAGADRGAYFAESDCIESDWKKVFWGQANYVKLFAAKKHVNTIICFNTINGFW